MKVEIDIPADLLPFLEKEREARSYPMDDDGDRYHAPHSMAELIVSILEEARFADDFRRRREEIRKLDPSEDDIQF